MALAAGDDLRASGTTLCCGFALQHHRRWSISTTLPSLAWMASSRSYSRMHIEGDDVGRRRAGL
jgi:hypothetical protein